MRGEGREFVLYPRKKNENSGPMVCSTCRLKWCQNELDCSESSASVSATDNVLVDTNGTLMIRRADKANQGVYVLRASNAFGRALSPGITLRLAGKNCVVVLRSVRIF